MKYLNLLVFSHLNPIYGIGQGTPNCSNATIIGNTFYENQANQGNPGRLIYEWPDNTMAAVWMIGYNTPTFSDRGTGYNFYNGSWNAIPTSRLEAVRTGFPNIIGGINNEEIIFAHEFQHIYSLFRANHGAGPWSESSLIWMPLLWPRFARGGISGQSIHLIGTEQIATNGQEYPLKYWRSPDNGSTWNIQDITIPSLDSSNTRMTSTVKNISCRGNVVAIVTGGFTDDLILCKSTDHGVTWTKTIINQFPIPLYNDETMISDVNADGIADTVETVDWANTLVIDNNNMVHVWAGRNRILDEDVPSSFGFFPLDGGIAYWNETMPPNTILSNIIAVTEDLNNDGIINIPVQQAPLNCGSPSMP